MKVLEAEGVEKFAASWRAVADQLAHGLGAAASH
jgi:hypothetical protein